MPAAGPTTPTPTVYLITGIQAAGKTTVAEALAERISPSVHIHGDQFRRWIVNGRRDMTPDPTPEAIAQLRLRHRLTAHACDLYARAGLTVVAQDVVLGPHLQFVIDEIRHRPLHLLVLAPDPGTVADRERARPKTSYGRWSIDQLDHDLRHGTPRLGLWLDTSTLTVEQTVTELLRRPYESQLPPP